MSLGDVVSVAAGAAGVAGLGLASYTFVGDRRAQARAVVAVELQRHADLTSNRDRSATRVAVINRGAGVARDVRVTFHGEDPASPSGVVFTDRNEPVITVPTLHPGEGYYVRVFVPIGRDLTHVIAFWRDGRRGVQERPTYLTVHDII